MNGLIAHAGTKRVPEADVMLVPAVERTPTWNPVSHKELIEIMGEAVDKSGLVVGQKAYSLSEGGKKMFGVWDLVGSGDDKVCYSMGLRNSIDKTFAIGICAGSHVFVCDNLAFRADFIEFRKHTGSLSYVELKMIASRAVLQLEPKMEEFLNWQTGLNEWEVPRHSMRDLIFEGVRQKIFPVTKFEMVCNLVYEDDAPYDKTLYGFHGAVTETHHDLSLVSLPQKNQILNDFVEYAKTEILA